MLSNSEGAESGQGTRPDAWLYLEEITHRALNEYTAMLAIVRSASRVVTDEASEQALGEVATRLRAAAMSFLALRPPMDGHLRDLSRELEPLCASLSSSFLSCRRITLTLTSESVAISAYRCWQLSLVVSELVTNAARHAFRLRQDGLIEVTTSVRNGNIECAVVDDGICDENITPGRGTAIVDALVNDLGGTISRHHSVTGSTIMLSIPRAEVFFVPAARRFVKSRSRPRAFGLSDIGDAE
jgi:two-component sensor histidine kinase